MTTTINGRYRQGWGRYIEYNEGDGNASGTAFAGFVVDEVESNDDYPRAHSADIRILRKGYGGQIELEEAHITILDDGQRAVTLADGITLRLPDLDDCRKVDRKHIFAALDLEDHLEDAELRTLSRGIFNRMAENATPMPPGS